MPFLASLRPLLRGSASVSITLSAAAHDGLSVVVQAKLEKFDADTTDSARAALQAALAHPIRVVIPSGADADAEFDAALRRVNDGRAPVVDDLQVYLDTLAQAQHTAKHEAAKAVEKKNKSGAKPAATTTTPRASGNPEPSSGDDDATDEAEAEAEAEASNGVADTTAAAVSSSSVAAGDVSPASPVAAAAATLFD